MTFYVKPHLEPYGVLASCPNPTSSLVVPRPCMGALEILKWLSLQTTAPTALILAHPHAHSGCTGFRDTSCISEPQVHGTAV